MFEKLARLLERLYGKLKHWYIVWHLTRLLARKPRSHIDHVGTQTPMACYLANFNRVSSISCEALF